MSYARDDGETAYREMQRLCEAGFNVWYDDGIRPGKSWRDDVALAITQASLVVYLVTPKSVKSENCHQELNFALSRDRQVLAVHLEKTDLTPGIELSLSNKQALLKYDLDPGSYQKRLAEAVGDLMPMFDRPRPDRSSPSAPPVSDEKSIAILPLTNRSSDEDNDYLCDGIAEELITGLSQVEGVRVVSQLSSFALRHQVLTPREIGERLRVEYVLIGSIQKARERVRVAVSLNDVDSETVTWTDRYDRPLDDILDVQEEIAANVVASLSSALIGNDDDEAPATVGERSLISTGTTNPRAYEYFLQGQQQQMRSTATGRLLAYDLFRNAVAEDPGFGRAWHRIFVNLWLRKINDGLANDDMVSLGRRAFDEIKRSTFPQALPNLWYEVRLDPEVAPDLKTSARLALAAVRDPEATWHGWEGVVIGTELAHAGVLNGCRLFYERYLNEHPAHLTDGYVLSSYGNLLIRLGRFDQAIEHFTTSYLLHEDPMHLGSRATLYSRTGQFERASADLAVLAKVFPRNFAAFYDLYWRGDEEAAKNYLAKMESGRTLAPIFKIWSRFLLGDVDGGFDVIDEQDVTISISSATLSSTRTWNILTNASSWHWALRVVVLQTLPPSTLSKVEAHPRYQKLIADLDLGDAWATELINEVNALEHITGIRVEPDDRS